MTTRQDYTDSEWKTLRDLPQLAAFAAIAVGQGDPIASTRELFAAMQQLGMSAQQNYPDNQLIRAIIVGLTETNGAAAGADETWRADAGAWRGAALVEQSHDTAARAREILDERSTDLEGTEYAAWVVGIARAACEAAGSGFFGFGGSRVSGAEQQFLADLGEALGMP
ncbi:MAG: hypothetical protein U0031_12400 [Thermomicrobiales bacterium]